MTISESLLPEFDREMTNTRKLLACLPDENLGWKPHEKSMTLGRLAGHVGEMPDWALHTLTFDLYEIPEDVKPHIATSQAELLQFFDKTVAAARPALAAASDDHLNQVWSLKWKGKVVMSMPRVAVLRNMVMNHMIHHRGQLGVYLRLQNISIPGMYGPSADEPRGM